MRHMRFIHPDFQLRALDDGGFTILWKKKPVGKTLPLTQLTPPRGPDCFIIGSGPSVVDLDLSRLGRYPCFGVNGSILKSIGNGVSYTYLFVTDRKFVLDRFELVRRILDSASDCLFSFSSLGVICEQAPELLADTRLFVLDEVNARYGIPRLELDEFNKQAAANRDFILHPQIKPAQGRVGFSLDIRQGVFTGQTVIYSAVQTACWLGYRRIFILGMDLGGTGHDIRFYESGIQAAPSRLDKDYEPFIRPAFEVAAKFLDKSGVKIYNLSPHSRLPESIIPKLSLSEALRMVNTKE